MTVSVNKNFACDGICGWDSPLAVGDSRVAGS